MNEYRDTRASLMRFISDFAAVRSEMVALNLDAFAAPLEWPVGDFIGLAEFQMDVDDKFLRPAAAFVISTRDDKNLFRMEQAVNDLLELLTPGRRVLMIDAQTGGPRGNLVVRNRTRVGTVEHTDTQPARPVMVSFQSDQTVRTG